MKKVKLQQKSTSHLVLLVPDSVSDTRVLERMRWACVFYEPVHAELDVVRAHEVDEPTYTLKLDNADNLILEEVKGADTCEDDAT